MNQADKNGVAPLRLARTLGLAQVIVKVLLDAGAEE